MPQGEFLLKLGLGQRRERLLRNATPAAEGMIASGAARLVDPHQMGVLFKVLAAHERRSPTTTSFRAGAIHPILADPPW